MEILRLNHSSWLITLDSITFVVDAHFSSAKNWNKISENEYKGHQAEFFLITQGDKRHFDLHSYKYVPQDKPIVVPQSLEFKTRNFFNNPIHACSEESPFTYKSIKIVSKPTSNSQFDWSALKKTNCHYFVIQSQEADIVISGYTSQVHFLKQEKSSSKAIVYILPFGSKPTSPFYGGPLLNSLRIKEIFNQLQGDYLIPFCEYPSDSSIKKIEPLTKASELEKKIPIVGIGESFKLEDKIQ